MRIGARIKVARGETKRREVADEAAKIAIRTWGEEAPFVDIEHVRDLETRTINPPSSGRIFRSVLAAVQVPLVVALEDLEYWPDISPSRRAQSPAQAVASTLQLLGLPDARLLGVNGRVIQIRF